MKSFRYSWGAFVTNVKFVLDRLTADWSIKPLHRKWSTLSLPAPRRSFTGSKGGILLMMLVILGVMVIVIGASVSYVNRQFHEITRQKQEEQVFHVAEAGVNHVLYLLNEGVYNTEQLLVLTDPIEQDITDPVSGTVNGQFSLTFAVVDGTQPGQAVRATSVARSDATSDRCQTVIATIRRVTSSGSEPFTISKWDHVPQCDALYGQPEQPPTLTGVVPADNSTDIEITTDLTMMFSHSVDAVAGTYLTIKQKSDGADAQAPIDLDPNSSSVSGSGTNTVIVNPPQSLQNSTEYFITIDEGAFINSYNLPYAGINETKDDDNTWNFTTIADPPTLVQKDPLDNATDVPTDKDITMTFSEQVWSGPGTVSIVNGGSSITINVADITGLPSDIVSLGPQGLAYSTDYHIEITGDAFKDDEPAWYAGIDNNVDWNFRTGDMPACSNPTFTKRVIDIGPNAYSIHAIDIDGDTDMDVVTASENFNGGSILWYENNNQVFTRRFIDSGVLNAHDAYPADMDNDGDIDVAAALYYGDDVVWYENNNQIFKKHVIDNNADRVYSVYVTDMDNDSDKDVISAIYAHNTVAYYNNSNLVFTRNNIGGTYRVNTAFAADIDGDGDKDIISHDDWDYDLIWFDNNNNVFTERLIHNDTLANYVYATDLDDDGDTDVLSNNYSDESLTWFMNNNQSFSRQIIDSTILSGGGGLHVADIDNDGDKDVVGSVYPDGGTNGFIAWYENDSQTFTKHVIDNIPSGAYSVFAADMDKDTDIDLLSVTPDEGILAWYEQTCQ